MNHALLYSLTNSLLIEKTQALASDERRIGVEVLWHLREIEKRRLYAEEGYPSLFEFCVKSLHYSEGAAGRRILAMRALKDIPEVEEGLKSGSLSLSSVSTLQSFIQNEKKKRPVSNEEKRALFQKIQKKSKRDVDVILSEISPESARLPEKERVLSPEETELKIVVSERLRKKLLRMKELLAHRFPEGAKYAESIELAVDEYLTRHDPMERAARMRERDQKKSEEGKCSRRNESASVASKLAERVSASHAPKAPFTPPAESSAAQTPRSPSSSTPASELGKAQPLRTPSPFAPTSESGAAQTPRATPVPPFTPRPHIPAAVTREVYLRDQGQCTHLHPKTEARCPSRYKLELDHVTPLAKGGATTTENLRLLCRAHNLQDAREAYGAKKMAAFAKS